MREVEVKEEVKSKEFKEEIEKLAKELSEIAKDPKMSEEAEKLHKKISYLSPEDLLKRFTI